jgi:hypothetical protein
VPEVEIGELDWFGQNTLPADLPLCGLHGEKCFTTRQPGEKEVYHANIHSVNLILLLIILLSHLYFVNWMNVKTQFLIDFRLIFCHNLQKNCNQSARSFHPYSVLAVFTSSMFVEL